MNRKQFASDRVALIKQLRAARKDAGMSRKKVAKIAGWAKGDVECIEEADGDIWLSTLQVYADAIGMRVVISLEPKEEAKPSFIEIWDDFAKQVGFIPPKNKF